MKKVVLLASVLVLLAMSMLSTRLVITVSGSTIHHVYSGESIQDAINLAQPGDTIIVHDGIYHEHVTINKSISLIGENRSTTVIDGNGTGNVICITANRVNVTEFTIRNGTNGIRIQTSDYNIINGNIVTDNLYGIHLYSVSCPCDFRHNNIILNNIIKNNDKGIFLGRAKDNVIYHNNFMNNTQQVDIHYSDFVNVWDDGYPSGGNYWSDYQETYPNAKELDNSGIWNTPYVIDVNNTDNYPLMNLTVQFSPIADFSYSPEFPLVGETITFNASASHDPDGSIIEYEWNFSDGNVTTVANPVITHVYTEPGTYTVNLTVTDDDGLTDSSIKSVTITKVRSIITVNIDYATVAVGSNVTINGTITPVQVDVNVTISYRPLGVTWTTLVTIKTDSNSHYKYTWKTTDGGTYEIKASWLGDENTSPAESETKTVTVTLPDSTPPTTTISLSGAEGNNGWFTSDVIVTLSASDDVSEVEKTEYSLDNATWTNYTMPFTITAEGTTIVYYKSTDKVGNVETTKTETIKIDKTVPSGSININNGDAYTILTSVKLTLTASDATSNVYQVRYSDDGVWDNEPWKTPSSIKVWTLTSGDGTKTVYYQIKDNAGLVSICYQDTITLDTTPPTISITSPDEGAEIRSSSLTITWNGSDATSGIDHYEIRLYGGSWINVGTNTTYTFAGVGDGRHAVEVKAFDKAGWSQVVSVNFTVNTSQIRGGPEYKEELTIIGVVVTIVALATAMYLLKIRKKT